MIKSAREIIEKDKPSGINVEALNTSDVGKEYLQVIKTAEDKLDSLEPAA